MDGPTRGLDTREIKALSPEEIAALEAGLGFSQALPAELNGYPGPRHVIDLAADLELTPAQQAAVEALFSRDAGRSDRGRTCNSHRRG